MSGLVAETALLQRVDDVRREYLRLEDTLMRLGLNEAQKELLNWNVLSLRKLLFGHIARPNAQDALREFRQAHPEIE